MSNWPEVERTNGQGHRRTHRRVGEQSKQTTNEQRECGRKSARLEMRNSRFQLPLCHSWGGVLERDRSTAWAAKGTLTSPWECPPAALDHQMCARCLLCGTSAPGVEARSGQRTAACLLRTSTGPGTSE